MNNKFKQVNKITGAAATNLLAVMMLVLLLLFAQGCNGKSSGKNGTSGRLALKDGVKDNSGEKVVKTVVTEKDLERANRPIPSPGVDTNSRSSLFFMASADNNSRENDFVIEGFTRPADSVTSPPPSGYVPGGVTTDVPPPSPVPVKDTPASGNDLSSLEDPDNPGAGGDVPVTVAAKPAVAPGGASADKAAANRAIKKYMPYGKGIRVESLKPAGVWSLARYSSTYQGETYYGSALLKKKGSGFNCIRTTGQGPTGDFLKLCGVPKNQWVPLLGQKTLDLHRLILADQRRHNKNAYYEDVVVAGDWVMVGWIEDPSGGQLLMKRLGTQYVSVTGTGGVMSDKTLKKFGVPPAVIKQLQGKARAYTPYDNIPGISDLP